MLVRGLSSRGASNLDADNPSGVNGTSVFLDVPSLFLNPPAMFQEADDGGGEPEGGGGELSFLASVVAGRRGGLGRAGAASSG